MRTLFIHILLLLSLPFLWHLLKTHHHASKSDDATLSSTQQNYYEQIFSYAMENLPDNGTYSWQEEDAAGSIRTAEKFISISKALCRRYAENFVIKGVKGTRQGVSCRRAGDDEASWCKLADHSEVMSCALEKPGDMFEWMDREGNDAKNHAAPTVNTLENGF